MDRGGPVSDTERTCVSGIPGGRRFVWPAPSSEWMDRDRMSGVVVVSCGGGVGWGIVSVSGGEGISPSGSLTAMSVSFCGGETDVGLWDGGDAGGDGRGGEEDDMVEDVCLLLFFGESGLCADVHFQTKTRSEGEMQRFAV